MMMLGWYDRQMIQYADYDSIVFYFTGFNTNTITRLRIHDSILTK
jgi:hypothetical protein